MDRIYALGLRSTDRNDAAVGSHDVRLHVQILRRPHKVGNVAQVAARDREVQRERVDWQRQGRQRPL